MLSLINGKIKFDYQYCQQCGSCISTCPTKSISITRLKNGLADIHINQETCILCKRCIKVCPATMEDHIDNYNISFPNKQYYFANNVDQQIRFQSSSGGSCKTIIIQALKQNLVDGVYTLGHSNKYPYAEGKFYSKESIPTYNEIPNSVYHSIMLNTNANTIPKCERLMVIGTNCQLKGLEVLLKHKCKTLIKVCIFCKQQKTLDCSLFLGKMMGSKITLKQPFTFQYRGNGWPGIVKIDNNQLPYSKASILPFGKRLWTVPGCNICGDPFSQFHADISLMDPWGGINANDHLGTTLITVHTNMGQELLSQIKNLTLIPKTYDEIKQGLSLNDINRKQILIPFFKKEKCTFKIKIAGHFELFQRSLFTFILCTLPKMPIIFYRIIHKIPDLRNIILK